MRKKLSAIIVLVFISLALFAQNTAVLLCPYDSNLAKLINNATGTEPKKTEKVITVEDLLAKDDNLISLILQEAEAQTIVVPEVIERDGIYLKKIHVISEGQSQVIFSEISQLDKNFGPESVLAILPYFSDQKVGLIRFESYKSGSVVKIDGKTINLVDDVYFIPQGEHEIQISTYGYTDLVSKVNVTAYKTISFSAEPKQIIYKNLTIDSNVKADVVKDTVLLGQTPFALDSYSIPSVLRLKSPGYTDFTISLKEETDSLYVNLKPKWMSEGEVYKKAKDSFYYDFARSILLYGAKVVFQSYKSEYPKLSTIGTQTASVLMTVSIGDLVYDLINYSRYAEYISP